MKNQTIIKDLVSQDLCVGCGICVSESPETLKMTWNDNGFLVPSQIEDSISSDAIKVCPFNPNPSKEVEDEDKLADIFLSPNIQRDEKIGKFINTYVGYSNEFRVTSSSGGIATYIFEQLLKQNIVDHLFIVKEVNGTYEYQLFNDEQKIKQISKTRYIPVTLAKLFLDINNLDGKIAISGVACFIKAIRLKQYYNPELKEKIPFLIGIICGGLKSRFFTDYLAQKSGINSTYKKQDYRIKDINSSASDYSFGAYDNKEEFHQLKMRSVGDMWGTGLFKSNACDFCDDVTTELAEISLGDAWLKPYNEEGLGNSIIITRSILADQLIKDGIEKNLLTIEEFSLEKLKSSQQGSFNHRHDGLKYRMEQRKKLKMLSPVKRERFFKNIPFYFKLVQKQRMTLRKSSLKIWHDTNNANTFDLLLKPLKDKLKQRTLFYHRMRKLKRILFN